MLVSLGIDYRTQGGASVVSDEKLSAKVSTSASDIGSFIKTQRETA